MKLELLKGDGPNLKDPRVERRAHDVLALAYDIQLSNDGVRRMSNKEFYAVIGQPNRNPGTYFKHLFVHAEAYSKGGKNYGYATVPHRVERLAHALGITNGLAEAAHRAGKSFLTDPGKRADQPRKGDRYYPWWATMKRVHRSTLFLQEHGRGWDYDLEAAKPTLTLQMWRSLMAVHHPMKLKYDSACQLPAWSALVSNRKLIRQNLAREAGLTDDQAKWAIQSVLNSGVASPKNSSFTDRLGVDGTKRLMAAPTYQALRTDFQTFWKHLKDMPIQFGEAKTAGEALSAFYNELEHRVMSVIEKELGDTRAWFIHDGFMTVDQVDKTRLEEAVRRELNLDVKLDETKLEVETETEE